MIFFFVRKTSSDYSSFLTQDEDITLFFKPFTVLLFSFIVSFEDQLQHACTCMTAIIIKDCIDDKYMRHTSTFTCLLFKYI